MADLDHFKQLNDTHGHEAGDRALRAFAHLTSQLLREQDVIARWGGEEFVLVLPDVDRHQAATVLERLRARLAESNHGSHPAFTASFGVTDSTRADTLEELLQLADAALYRSKSEGRDRATVNDSTSDGATPSFVRPPERDETIAARALRRTLHSDSEDDARPSGAEIR
jgi:diguanylate cyclase (GGDEF)-like protein